MRRLKMTATPNEVTAVATVAIDMGNAKSVEAALNSLTDLLVRSSDRRVRMKPIIGTKINVRSSAIRDTRSAPCAMTATATGARCAAVREPLRPRPRKMTPRVVNARNCSSSRVRRLPHHPLVVHRRPCSVEPSRLTSNTSTTSRVKPFRLAKNALNVHRVTPRRAMATAGAHPESLRSTLRARRKTSEKQLRKNARRVQSSICPSVRATLPSERLQNLPSSAALARAKKR